MIYFNSETLVAMYQERQSANVLQKNERDCPKHNTPQCAIPIEIGKRENASFTRDLVYYKFNVENPDEFIFTLNPVPNTRGISLELQDGDYNRMYRSSFEAGHPSSADFKIRTPGEYYLVLRPASCCSGANTKYGLLISTAEQTPVLDIVATDCPKRNTPQCAIPLNIGEMDSDTFNRNEIYYTFDLEDAKKIKFTLDPMPVTRGVSLEIKDSNYNMVTNHSFEKGNPGNFEFDFLNKGKYYLLLKPAACCSGGSNDYTIAVSE
ncbi:hypothetical protein GCM10007103_14650 [Salinimicrobium marinum]|uniref:Pre-peptidase C-terminal domain-containing protein n=2 Tax=Salinimicrobium marinum TaxID=680283 RepID=A0A918SE02_9FLAO|nr:hypothetical protein GCM10007103_14650 [Salinimicrobium marinum]